MPMAMVSRNQFLAATFLPCRKACLEKGEYNQDYHMSLKAAEYYWHFVDIVWIFLFFTLYLF